MQPEKRGAPRAYRQRITFWQGGFTVKRNSQAGFTLIELIVVILILGILGAVALPRFINAQQDARIAKAQGLYGSIRSAAALAKARCELDLARAVGTCTSAGGTATMDGAAVTMVNRYPAATAAGIQTAAQIDAANDGVTIVAGPPFLIQINGATTPATCQISYTAAAAVGAAPTITLATAGC
jgi:MSHA pilin protein MshA